MTFSSTDLGDAKWHAAAILLEAELVVEENSLRSFGAEVSLAIA